MSDERRDGAIDLAIDEVARQMTAGELSSDFRARVVARIADGGRPRRTWHAAWILSPLAAAAVLAVAIFVARFQPLHPSSPSTIAQATRPVESAGRPSPSAPSAEAVPKGPVPHPAPQPSLTYATREIDALAPPPLEVGPLGLEVLPTASIAVSQLDAIAPIAVEPLPEIEQRPATNDQRP